MSLIRSRSPRHPAAVAAALLWALGAVLTLAGCSNNANRAVTGTVGVASGVALATAGSATTLLEGTTLAVAASVPSDTTNAGVTWAITSGGGTLTGVSPSGVTYVAPASVTGAATVIITATSIANTTLTAQVALVVLGSPQINSTTLFPANLNVPYAAVLSISGGQAPFTWAVASGSTLPPGMVLNASTTALTSISGTPTTLGSYTFTVNISDSLNRTSSLTLTMIVDPQLACVLFGKYVFTWTGFRGNSAATHTGVINIDSSGFITGETDFKNAVRTTAAETVIPGAAGNIGSHCVNIATNTGVIGLQTPSGIYEYIFAVTPPDANGLIHSARLQLYNAGGDSGSGELTLQDPTALGGGAPSGNYAFGLVGVDGQQLHFGTAGRFTATAGALSAGLVDANATTALVDAPLTGSASAPDALGRGTLTLAAGGTSTTLAYYIVNAQKLWVADIDTAANTPTESGVVTVQTGTAGPTTFDNTVLTSPSILSLWGALGNVDPFTVVELGRLSNGVAAAGSSTAGTVDITLQSSDQGAIASDTLTTSQSYTVDPASGRGTLTLVNGTVTRNFVIYFDGLADGYLVEVGSASGNAGLLEAQSVPVGGFSATLPGVFIGSTQYAQAPGPIILIPQLSLSYGSLSGTYASGTFAIDPSSGRGLGAITETGIGSLASAFYIVSPTKIDLLQYSTRATNGAILWLVQN